MVKELLGDHETIIVHLRKDVDTSTDVNKDAGTADFDWLDGHETMAWTLRRYLE
jgi:starvation-inducible DNA-binding protein